MNCPHCGAPVTLEQKFCPSCGMPNKQAAQHSRDMAHYNSEFEKTRRGVYGTLKAYKGITARLLVFVIAIIVMIVAFVLMNNSYSIHKNRMIKQAKAHGDEIEAQIADYLKHGDYVTLYHYSDHYALTNHSYEKDDRFSKYYPALVMVRDYAGLYADLMSLITPDDLSDQKRLLSAVNDDISYLYKHLYEGDENFYDYGDPDLSYRTRDGVEKQADALLIRYLKFTPDEAEAFHSMSEGKRNSLLDDKFEMIKNARENESDE